MVRAKSDKYDEYVKMSVEDLTAELEELDEQRMTIKEQGAEIQEIIKDKLEEDQYDHWGVTPEQYAEARKVANPHRVKERELDALITKQNRLRVKSVDDRKPQKVRVEAEDEADGMEESIDKLYKEVEELKKHTSPLHAALGKFARGNRKKLREGQTASAQPVKSNVEGK